MAKVNVYKMHEARMRMKDILIPVVGFMAGFILSDEDKRQKIKDTLIDAKNKVLARVKR